MKDNNKIFKQTLYLIALLLTINLVYAANTTIDGLIDSFNYNFTNSTVSVTAKSDSMADTNSNGISDVLTIQLTTSVTNDNTLNFIVTLLDKDRLFINTTTKLVTSSDNIVQIKFPTELLESDKFNYTIEINTADNELVYREYKTETNIYSSYEKGTNITKIADENVNNNFVRINLTVNSTSSLTTNVTVTLAFNSSSVSKTEEKTLSNGLQVVSINFDNETIKSTHYAGNFTIDKVIIGNKIFEFNQNTSIYNYEDFAKTSYIKSITDGRIDTNANNLSDFLEINFTINAKTADTYNLTYDLYDQFNNFVIGINKTQTLALGNQTVQTLINGSEIYKTKINGPYVINFAKLSIGNDTKDILLNAHTTNQSFYTDYERPPLPDLKVTLSALFNQTSNVTDIIVNLSNVGTAPAFNVFLDIFDNVTYNNNRSLSFFSNGDKVTYQFNVTNSSNASLITVIADFDNLVDEINESNNIAQNTEVNVTSEIVDQNKLSVKNSTGQTTAWLSDSGNIFLNGVLNVYSNYQRTANDELIMRFNEEDVLIIDKQNGSMYIKGNILENQNTFNIKDNSDEWIIKDTNGNVVLYVNESGYVFMKGTVTANKITGYKNSFAVKDALGNNVARFDDSGNVVLKGALEQNSNYQRTANDEWVIRNNENDVFILDKVNGSLYIDGSLFEKQTALNPKEGSDDFIIKNELGNAVGYVNESGSMFLRGTLTQNGNP